ncbi:MAG: class I SAM-dependent methyltransferase [Candidatus Eremiobacteraeota bacterium]|nr:class I SAM-dependent methyltransferase [Candidatus Eremiobacteraeota bacterium]MBC5802725.1 class I SAM-dependent methyltransferase [Candidatus Eremiobacteraeota bacterium]MBC5821573.1 class I SAM-dependent methyltransferase [Candidatus Eremiobacteraeota bacterium]
MQHAPVGSFDELADAYDRYRIGYAPELYDALFAYGLDAGQRVVDVGCGTGLVTAELARRGCSVTGVDCSEAMLAHARERVRPASFSNARAECLPFGSASFDAATSAQAFHWFDQPQALVECARVVRPGGIVAIWWKGLMRGDATRLLREQAAHAVGQQPPADILANDFDAYDGAPFVDKHLRIVPWIVHMPVGEFLGYERSRAMARDTYGERLEDYFTALRERLGPAEGDLALSYVQLLYLGRVPTVA